jgi:hypothetical protein
MIETLKDSFLTPYGLFIPFYLRLRNGLRLNVARDVHSWRHRQRLGDGGKRSRGGGFGGWEGNVEKLAVWRSARFHCSLFGVVSVMLSDVGT